MYKYSIFFDGEAVGIISETDLSPILEKWKKIPYLTGITVNEGGEHEFTLEYVNCSQYSINYYAKSVKLAGPKKELSSGEILFYATLPFFEVLYQRSSIVTLHAAAVELNGKGILLIGRSGAGKTSIVLSLCRNYQAKLIGNDIVKLGLRENTIEACSGSKYFFLRQESIKRNIPELLNFFPISTKDSWRHKIYCYPPELEIAIFNRAVPIAHSYFVHIDETMEKMHISSADNLDSRLYLNENMSRYIRGTAIALFNSSSQFIGYVPSFDNPDFFKMRVNMIQTLISSSNSKYIGGNLNDVCKYILCI